MKKNNPLYLYGAVLIFAGIFLLFAPYFEIRTIQLTLGITLVIGAILGFGKALSRFKKQVEFSYHEIHALAMMVYGFTVLLFASTLETLIYVSTFLMFFYSFSEIIFCSWLFNLGRKVVYKIVFVRIILGLAVGIGTLLIMQYNTETNISSLYGFGVLFIIIGINILLYLPVMKPKELTAV